MTDTAEGKRLPANRYEGDRIDRQRKHDEEIKKLLKDVAFWEEERRKAALAECERAEQLAKAEGACMRLREAHEAAAIERDAAVEACDTNWVTHQQVAAIRVERDEALAEVTRLRAGIEHSLSALSLNQMRERLQETAAGKHD